MWLVGVRAKALADCWYAKGYKIQGFKGTTAGSWLLVQIGPRDSRIKDSKKWQLATGTDWAEGLKILWIFLFV